MKRIPLAIGNIAAAARDILKNRLMQVFVAISASYWLTAIFVSGKDLIEILGLVAIGIFATSAVRWYFPSARSLREGDTSGVAQLMLGVTGFMAYSAVTRIWSQIWRWNDYAKWMMESPWLGYILLTGICSAALTITSPGARDGAVPARNWKALAIAIGIGGVLVGFMLKTAVDTKLQSGVVRMGDLQLMVSPMCPNGRIWGFKRTTSGRVPAGFAPGACFNSKTERKLYGYVD